MGETYLYSRKNTRMECRSLRDGGTSTDLKMGGGLRNWGDSEEKGQSSERGGLTRSEGGHTGRFEPG